ncbi:PIG-L family deacetylase [Serinibacter salmoneus]|uniref:PIG-L family deacetylase n=1 Tax=Serinibacter salmoneus TaxID=556530 RepID=UPI0014740113|nr:bifunctional PIG-L family deacetylase/class I SAM-dependent methyltransferase [Serinibacter salmoneus]
MRFDAREPGTPAAVWLSEPRLEDLPRLGLPEGPTLVLAAHPDDETIGAGGLIAELALLGRPPLVVIATDGAAAAGEVDGALAERRAEELREALEQLAPGLEPVLLALPDGEVREHRADLTARLAALLEEQEPSITTIVAPWRDDAHRDHRILGEVAAELAATRGTTLWEYPLWMWHWATPETPQVPWARMHRLLLQGEAAARRARAVDCHTSQVTPSAAGEPPVVPHDLRRITGRGAETFVVTRPERDQVAHAQPARTGTPGEGTPADHFHAAYRRRPDPWHLRTRWYEQRKRDLTMAALPEERFGRALEVGCSVGVLTQRLARRCEEVLAIDVVPEAIESARQATRDHPHVRLEVRDVREGLPAGPFDLVVLSEVLYYLGPEALTGLVEDAAAQLTPHGVVLACHWRHDVEHHARSGDDAHEALARTLAGEGIERTARYADADVLLEVYSRDPRSVAVRSGLL